MSYRQSCLDKMMGVCTVNMSVCVNVEHIDLWQEAGIKPTTCMTITRPVESLLDGLATFKDRTPFCHRGFMTL